MKKYTWLYLLIPLFICLLYIEKLFKLNTNLQTNFDEGFYFLSIWKVKHGILNEGLSLWTLLINATCSEKISSTILNLRYLRFFTQITTITIFTCITSFYLVKKGILNTLLKIILYISLVFWIGYFTLEDKIITYNELQSFFLSVMIALFLLSTVCQSKTELYIYFIIGFISFLSFVTIPPSGIIVSISIFIMILTKYWNYKKKIIQVSTICFIGFIISALFIHFFILDLNVVLKNMLISTNKISHLNRGYDPFSLLTKLIIYFRDFFIITILMSGILFWYFIINKHSKNWLSILFFIFSIAILLIYQKKPRIPLSTLWAFPFIVFLLLKLKKETFPHIITYFKFSALIYVFIFVSPLLSAIGTNTDLNGKMLCFILPWSVLYAELFNHINLNKRLERLKWIFIICLFIMVHQPINALILDLTNKTTPYYFNQFKPISGIKLNEPQYQYFNRINKIFKKYNYESNKKVIFATTFDHMTISIFEGIPCETYQLPNDFIAENNKKRLLKPDFIFLNKYDYKMMSDSIILLDWGFPEKYDKYFVGTPDPNSIWDSQRWLYCLKIK